MPAVAHTEDNAYKLIKAAHERGRMAHAFLIIGQEEDGTHRLASRMVSMLNSKVEQPATFDLFGEPASPSEESDIKPFDELEDELVRILKTEKKSRIISANAMREFEKSFYTSAPKGKWNIGIIAEADRMNDSSSNAFLKTLEEPPQQTLLILLTSKPEQLLTTILSRCVKINLIKGSHSPSTSEMQLIQSIASQCKNGFESDISALRMKSLFTAILAERRADLTKVYDLALKDEQLQYAKSTDGTWLKEREDYYKARTEIDYLFERSQLMDTMVSWFGDIVRKKCDFPHLDFPQLKKLTTQLAESEETSSLMLRMNSLENLRDALNTNADEKLALEVGFMQTFG